jgi:hypothetical protein
VAAREEEDRWPALTPSDTGSGLDTDYDRAFERLQRIATAKLGKPP